MFTLSAYPPLLALPTLLRSTLISGNKLRQGSRMSNGCVQLRPTSASRAVAAAAGMVGREQEALCLSNTRSRLRLWTWSMRWCRKYCHWPAGNTFPASNMNLHTTNLPSGWQATLLYLHQSLQLLPTCQSSPMTGFSDACRICINLMARVRDSGFLIDAMSDLYQSS